MSPNKAAKKASHLYTHDISARVITDKRTGKEVVQLGWDHLVLKRVRTGPMPWDRSSRFEKVFDIMGSGPTPEMALDDLIDGMTMEDQVFPEIQDDLKMVEGLS